MDGVFTVIADDRMVTYINSLDAGNTPLLNEIEERAVQDNIPVIRKEIQSFLKVLICMKQPKRVLEIGTAVGFSTLLFCEYGTRDCHVTTIEKYKKRIPAAKENFRRAGRENRITLLEGDAIELLKQLDGPFDFVFVDAAKGQYIHYLQDILRLLEKGGVLISDNVLQDGDIIESHYAVERRNRTIYKRMREYLYELKHNEQLITAVIPIGDGVTLSTKL